MQHKKSRKKKKPRYPKSYDPSKPNGGLPPPDPERWLPKWQRSDAKKKKTRQRDRNKVRYPQRQRRMYWVFACTTQPPRQCPVAA